MKRKHTLNAAIHSHAMIVLRLRSDIKLLLSPLFFLLLLLFLAYIHIHKYSHELIIIIIVVVFINNKNIKSSSYHY